MPLCGICKKCVIAAFACVVVILLFTSYFWGRLSVDDKFLFSAVTRETVNESQSTLNVERNLRLISYNLWCDHFSPHSLWNVNDRIQMLADGIKKFDIALIQEAYILNTGFAVISNCASLLVKAMEKRGFHYRTSVTDFLAPYVGKSGGIVIFSRIPLARTISRQFHNYSCLQSADYRGFVVGEYFVNSRHLHIINTHLDPRQAKTRTLQAKELTTATKNFTKSSHLIVGGDFNIDNLYPTVSNCSKEYIELLKTMDEAGLRSVFPLRKETNIDGGNYDAIFTSSNVAVVRKKIIKLVTTSKELVSDHYGLAVEFKLL